MKNVLVAVLFAAACGKPAEPPPQKPVETGGATAKPADPVVKPNEPTAKPTGPTERDIVAEGGTLKVPLTVRLPGGWEPHGSNGFHPVGDMGDVSFGFFATCDGECKAETTADKIAAMVKAAPDNATRPNTGTGDPELDAVRLDVKVVEEGDLEGGKFVVFRVTRPEGSKAPSFVEGFRAFCAKQKAGADHFVYAQARAPFANEKDLWPLALEACKSWQIK
jgi:hypothetical protein